MGGRQRRVGRRHVGGFVHPEIEDPRRDHDVVRRRQQVVHRVEHRCPADVGYPQRRIAQLVQFRCGIGRFRLVAVAQSVVPDSYTREIHASSYPTAAKLTVAVAPSSPSSPR